MSKKTTIILAIALALTLAGCSANAQTRLSEPFAQGMASSFKTAEHMKEAQPELTATNDAVQPEAAAAIDPSQPEPANASDASQLEPDTASDVSQPEPANAIDASQSEPGIAADAPEQDAEADESLPYEVSLYFPDEEAMYFCTKTVATNGKPEHLVSLLAKEKAIPKDSVALGFSIDENGRLLLDMNKAYTAGIDNGTCSEISTMGSLVNTFLTYYGASELLLTIEGEVLVTGHNGYDYPITFYEQI
jgi:hypothetical protein